MKRAGTAKFPNSVQLFKFCYKVLLHQRGDKVRDQDVGVILDFNPSDCSHWKRGEKNVRSVFSLAKLAEEMQVEVSLVHDVASGAATVDEAYFEYLESRAMNETLQKALQVPSEEMRTARERTQKFVNAILAQSDFTTPPLYLPEVLRSFAFIGTQPMEMMDKLSRILRVKAGQYCIHYRKGDLKPQTRWSMVKDLGRILFEGERARFPELGAANPNLVEYEEAIFAANLLVPQSMIVDEMSKLDSRRNVVAELAAIFWVPKSLVGFQLRDMLRGGRVIASIGGAETINLGKDIGSIAS